MYLFPSDEWIRAFVEELHKSKVYAEVAQDWDADLYYVVEAEGALLETVYIYADMHHGKCREARICRNPAEKKPAFTISAPLSVWRKIQQQELHPIVALVRAQLRVQGNMLKLIQNSKRTHEFFECATRVPTYYPEWPINLAGDKMPEVDFTKQLTEILRTLQTTTPGLIGAAVISIDGFAIAAELPASVEERRVAAMAAAMLALGEQTTSEFDQGNLQRVFVEGKNGYTIIMSAGPEVVLSAVARKDAKMGLVFLQMERAVQGIVKAMK